jgi:hypothetical protein
MARARTVAVIVLAGGALFAGSRALRRRYGTDEPASLPVALRSAAGELGELLSAVRHGMTEREGELRVALGLDVPPPGTRLDQDAVRKLLDDPAGPSGRRP